MRKNFGIGLMIFCFGLSSVNVGLASEVINLQPVVVQPFDTGAMSEQMLMQDRLNRDQEMVIKGLVDENQRLSSDAALAKVTQVITQSQRNSKYYDLIRLTEDVDNIRGDGQTLQLQSNAIEDKYQVLTDLKNEMLALNDKLKNNQEEKVSTLIDPQEEAKIEMLTQKLSGTDQKISQFDEILAQKDKEIQDLKGNLTSVQNVANSQDKIIIEKQSQLELLKSELENKITELKNQGQNSTVVQALQQQIDSLKSQLDQKTTELNGQVQKESTIQELQNEIDSLRSQLDEKTSELKNIDQRDAATIQQKQKEIGALKSNLDQKISELSALSQKDAIIKEQESQIAELKAESQQLSSQNSLIKLQADQMLKASEQLKDKGVNLADFKNRWMLLRNKIQQDDAEFKTKDDSIRLLNHVVEALKMKVKYYQLTTQINQIPLKEVQDEVSDIKADFSQRFKDYNHFEDAITSLKDQVSALAAQLQGKQVQVNTLQSELDNKTAEAKNQSQQDAQVEQDLKDQLQDKENQIIKMKADVQAILQDQANKEIYRRNTSLQIDDRIKLAQQLIDLQAQETALLEEKDNLAKAQNTMFDQHAVNLENKIKELLVKHRIQDIILENRMEELKGRLSQKEQQVEALESQLKDKIAQEKNQAVLVEQIEDLKTQLQEKENQISVMRANIETGLKTQEELDSFKQQFAAEQDKAAQLRKELDGKSAESDYATEMMGDYQKKLEAQDNASNEQMRQALMAKKFLGQLEKQIADLNSELQEKESQVIHIKKDMYDLQESNDTKLKDDQANDLNLSMIQQKMLDDKIKGYQDKIDQMQAIGVNQVKMISTLRADLALARQELQGSPSADEVEFLRTGLKKATLQLKEKDAILFQFKTNTQEYEKEFQEQIKDFKSLKDQLQEAQAQIAQKDEDLKYKDLAILRTKYISRTSESDLKVQVLALSQRLDVAEKKLMGKTQGNKVAELEGRLKNANLQIRDLREHLDQLKGISNKDIAAQKLKQALDKIDQQGTLINILVQKLQDFGKTVDLAKISSQQ